jgi:methylated-DNA-protein-cysteine methyltransferase-like protein
MSFFQNVYEVVKQIPKGKVASYGQIARICGNARMARQVGWALHVNPAQGEIPCHRVVNKSGCLAGAFAFGGPLSQKALLELEGVKVRDDLFVDMKVYQWEA